jgi:para-aminobenzoate synthetase component 1
VENNAHINGFRNFLICKNPANNNLFQKIHIDEGGKQFTGKNCLCLIAYKNPYKKKVEPVFYEVKKQEPFVFDQQLVKTENSLKLTASTLKSDYIKNLKFLKDQIRKGNIYEINYCIEFFSDNTAIDPVAVYHKLNTLTKAPYSSLVKIGDDYIISASPELFLKKENSMLFSKPIKGTAKRGKTEKEDIESKNNLFNNIKERTENVMAVDVARNDLSIIAKRGTVAVNKLYNIETYETVHQMVSTVSCELKDNIKFEAIINAAFPMASMTGAPKASAMNLIDETENFERNYYSGAMGLVNERGDFELAVNIRSIFYNQKTKRLSIAVGSAVTHLCDPEKEYEECLLKADALLKALNTTIE